MATKFAKNPAVHNDIQAIGNTVILIIETFKVSGSLRVFPFLLLLIHECLL
jgi:hypothetical protein